MKYGIFSSVRRPLKKKVLLMTSVYLGKWGILFSNIHPFIELFEI